ncbi:MAG TPA: hypothetical protein VFQ61_11735 [Polyangiaceae bacterium]|nr:hypothetical protein [Polyangiaceae bacterium]
MNEPRPSATLAVTMSSFPSARIVGAVSKLVSEFCRSLIEDPDVAARFHMAAQELAENLAKYSSGPHVSISAELIGTDTSAILRLQAKNRSTPQQLEAVALRLQELTSAEDPIELYDRLIRETAPLDDVSGLGLARIRAEGGLDVDYMIDGNELTISVHASVMPQGAA